MCKLDVALWLIVVVLDDSVAQGFAARRLHLPDLFAQTLGGGVEFGKALEEFTDEAGYRAQGVVNLVDLSD
jgi:non-canonical (house-cleaning) NTP pyrophosphatase